MKQLNVHFLVGGIRKKHTVTGFSNNPAKDLQDAKGDSDLLKSLGVDFKSPLLVCLPGGKQ